MCLLSKQLYFFDHSDKSSYCIAYEQKFKCATTEDVNSWVNEVQGLVHKSIKAREAAEQRTLGQRSVLQAKVARERSDVQLVFGFAIVLSFVLSVTDAELRPEKGGKLEEVLENIDWSLTGTPRI